MVRKVLNASLKFAGTPSAEQRIAVPLLLQHGQHPEVGEAEVRANLLGRLDAAVHVLEERDQPAGEERPEEQREELVPGSIRADRGPGFLRRIDDPDIAGPELAGDAGFLRALQQVVVQLRARFHVALQDAVGDRLAVHRQRFRLLLVERRHQAVLVRQCRLVLAAHGLHDLLDFAGQFRFGQPDGRRPA